MHFRSLYLYFKIKELEETLIRFLLIIKFNTLKKYIKVIFSIDYIKLSL
jgi:hypothetical protein